MGRKKNAALKIGDFLYRNAFPIYNLIYPFVKRNQDRFEISLLSQYVKPGDVVLDIGSNIGFYTQLLSGWVGPTGKVFGFEPDHRNFSHLRHNAKHLKNVELFQAAVSDQSGTIRLYCSDVLNVDHKTYLTENSTSSYPVESLRLDERFENKRVDFIKIDIQGYEYFAMKGLQKVLQNNPAIKILSELYPYGIRASGASLEGYLDQFLNLGFKVFTLDRDRLIPFHQKAVTNEDYLDRFRYFNLLIYR